MPDRHVPTGASARSPGKPRYPPNPYGPCDPRAREEYATPGLSSLSALHSSSPPPTTDASTYSPRLRPHVYVTYGAQRSPSVSGHGSSRPSSTQLSRQNSSRQNSSQYGGGYGTPQGSEYTADTRFWVPPQDHQSQPSGPSGRDEHVASGHRSPAELYTQQGPVTRSTDYEESTHGRADSVSRDQGYNQYIPSAFGVPGGARTSDPSRDGRPPIHRRLSEIRTASGYSTPSLSPQQKENPRRGHNGR